MQTFEAMKLPPAKGIDESIREAGKAIIETVRKPMKEGAIFNTMSDTEVMVHLIARSRERDLERALVDALSRVKGAYSIALLAPGKIFAAREM